MHTASKLGVHTQTDRETFPGVGLGPVVARARVLILEVLDRGAQAAARGGARCALQVLDRGAQADARNAAQVLNLGSQAVARGAARLALQVLDLCIKFESRGAAQVLHRGAQPDPLVVVVST
jgi:hypothetical protein